jgi:tight adherence protein B
MDLIASSAIFAAILIILIMVLNAVWRRGEHARMGELLEEATGDSERAQSHELLRAEPRGRTDFGSSLAILSWSRPLTRLEDKTRQAGIYLRASQMLAIILLCAGLGGGVGLFVTGDLALTLGCAAGTGLLPILYVRWRRNRRLAAFAVQLPFALDLIKSSLEAGHSLLRGLQVLVDEFAEPLGSEFRIVLEQTRLGMPVARAFDELLKRVPADDLRLLAIAIKVQSEVGNSLAQIIGRLSELVRTRQRLQAQISSMTAQSRMSGMIVGLLPAFVLLAFSLVQPGYVNVLFYDPTGLFVLKAAIGLDCLAFLTIRRLLRIDY